MRIRHSLAWTKSSREAVTMLRMWQGGGGPPGTGQFGAVCAEPVQDGELVNQLTGEPEDGWA